ncbi:MAG TPA: YciI family protein [Bryocella sp.]|nr:YciI family protein [Bryocella sp.]
MKYMLLMNNMTSGDAYAGVSGWRNEDIQAHIAFMKDVTASLDRSGELVSTEGLALPDEAKIVRAGQNGEPATDGVFPESKEFLAGYWIVDVASSERAYQIAAKASAAPGPGGTTLNMPIEVRRIMPPETRTPPKK